MRPRKTLLPLTMGNLKSVLDPGKAYTADVLCMIFAASKEDMRDMLEKAVVAGSMQASKPRRGFRRTYWVTAPRIEPNKPAYMTTELRGYAEQLRNFVSLCMEGPRG